MKIESVKTGAFRTDFFRFGSGGRTLVILPGLSVQSVMLSADAIKEAYSPLAKEFTVYVFDRRRELPPVYSTEEMANDAAAAIAAAGIGRACLFGASQGAMMAMKIAAAHPGLTEKLVLASVPVRVTDTERAVFKRWIALARAKDREKLYLAFGEALYPPAVLDAARATLLDASKSVSEEDLRRFVILAGAAEDFDATGDLSRICCPTLVFGDTGDRVFGGGAAHAVFDRLKDRTDAEIHVYDGYGHALYDTAPDFKERVLRFLVKEG